MSADFWAGYVSGAAGIVIGNPLDLIKVRLQAAPTTAFLANDLPTASPTSSSSSSASFPATSAPSLKPRIRTLRDALRGLPAPVLTYGALNALLFTTYNRSLFLFSRPPSADSLWSYDLAASAPASATYPYWAHFTAGALAGLATFIISAPTELIKCRAQLARDSSNPGGEAGGPARPQSSWQIAKSTLRSHGIPGLYQGCVVTSVRDALGYGVYFLTYEAGKDLWVSMAKGGGVEGGIEREGGGVLASGWGWSAGAGGETAKILLCGGVAGIATWASIFPLDVVKTRVQAQVQPVLSHVPTIPEQTALLAQQNIVSGQRQIRTNWAARLFGYDATSERQRVAKPAGAWKIAKHAYRTEGASVFFRGLTVCCVRAFIVNAVQWAVYEWMMKELQ